MGMEETRATWDAQASSFDDEPDHGLRDSVTRQVWWSLLRDALPEAGSLVADLGCGTGTLAVLLAENNYRIRGIDLSPRMIELACRKTSDFGEDVLLEVGDASRPPWPPATFDAVISRHVVWALPDPIDALARWVALLRDGGHLILVEGQWETGSGISAPAIVSMLPPEVAEVEVHPLTDPLLWGREVSDERYMVTARVACASAAESATQLQG